MTITQEINTPRVVAQGLCLNMIVKNEVKILERCLTSVAPWISHYVIGDTGSTDGTQDLIRAFFDARGIPGEIHEFEFEDYSQARNVALEFCKKSQGKFENILFIDADMELKVDDPTFFSDEAQHRWPPVADVRQSNDQLDYDNVRLLNRRIESRYVEPTHEYLATPFTPLHVEGIWFLDHACGSNRGEKSARDSRLLEASLIKDPNNARNMFYLAQTYKDMGEWEKAIAWFLKRKQAGGWDEEVWYSVYMMAGCYKNLATVCDAEQGCGESEKFEYEAKFIALSLEAYQLRPRRAESLHVLANFFRNEGKSELALIISEAGKRIPYPNDKLFVEHAIYNYGFDEEIGISGFYAQNPERKQAGHDTCMALTVNRKVPEHVRKNAIENSGFYAKSAKELFPSFETYELPLMKLNPCGASLAKSDPLWSDGYRSMNPSVAIDGDTLHCIIRTVNYTMDEAQRYHMPSDNIIRTRNYHLRCPLSVSELTKSIKHKRNISNIKTPVMGSKITHSSTAIREGLASLRDVVSASEEIVEIQSEEITDFPVKGYEDCRLFKWQKDWWCSATVRDRHPHGQCEMVLFNPRTKREHVIRDFGTHQHQKNWVPLVTQFDQLLFIYMADPTIILEIDPHSLVCKKRCENEPSFNLSNLRGGSQAIPFTSTEPWKPKGANDFTRWKNERGPESAGWIYLAHEVAGKVSGGRSRYLHRFVELDRNFVIKNVSNSFYFMGQGIEFCAGLARKDDNLLISFGFEDRQAFIAIVNESEIRKFLTAPQAQGNTL